MCECIALKGHFGEATGPVKRETETDRNRQTDTDRNRRTDTDKEMNNDKRILTWLSAQVVEYPQSMGDAMSRHS